MGLFWGSIVYGVIPLALLLLCLLLFMPRALTEKVTGLVEKLIFCDLGVTRFPAIVVLVSGLGTLMLAQGYAAMRPLSQTNTTEAYNRELMSAWRRQRNAYLSALAFVLWWFVYTAYSYNKKLVEATKKSEKKHQ